MFFDRDGTLTVDKGYTYRREDFAWLPGAVEAIRACNDAGWLAIIVTNQSGIARGYFSEMEMRAFHSELKQRLADHGAKIDAVYFCPFHNDGVIDRYIASNHPDRKPNPGMIRRAIVEFSIDANRSVMFGDSQIDVDAALAAGVKGMRVIPGDLQSAVIAALEQDERQSGRWVGKTGMTGLESLRIRADRARAWMFGSALPFWWNVGFDRNAGLYHERIGLDGVPATDLPRRVRVQARQTFVYAMAGHLGWSGPWREATEAAAAALVQKCMRSDGGTYHTLNREGAALDPRRDLYDLAFVVFGLTHAAKALGDRPDLIETAESLLTWLQANWRHPAGGFREGEVTSALPRRQNPHMHLFEARLALYGATGDRKHLDQANEIAVLFSSSFFEPSSNALPEYFDDEWHPMPGNEGRIVEPGHHFEWSWLFHRLAAAGGVDHRDIAERLRVHGEVYGVDPKTGITFDEVFANGVPKARTSRLWPHTERIKANLARYEHTGDPNAASAVVQAFDVLQTYLETPIAGLWRDRKREDGTFVEEAAPASSFYHIVLAYAELMRVANIT